MCRVRKRPEHYYTETEEPENKTCFLYTDLLVKSQNDKHESAEWCERNGEDDLQYGAGGTGECVAVDRQ